MEDRWLHLTKRLHAIASTGIFFSTSEFDRERFEELKEIANEMLSDLASKPLKSVTDLFPEFGKSYATPLIDVRAAVIRDEKILLVKEKLDGLWTLPGGFADVGLSAAENAVKEVHEEAGIDVSTEHLLGVFHKSKHEYTQDIRDFYKFYFLCSELSDKEPEVGPETTDVGFFKIDQLPPLSEGRSIEKHIRLAFDYQSGNAPATVFD